MDRLVMQQRVFVREGEDGKAVNRHGTVSRILTDGLRAWVRLDAKGGGAGEEKVRVYPSGCDPSVRAPRAERRAAEREAAEPTATLATFGRDHWSTFAYIETRVVDHGGVPHRPHMRCHGDRHPFLVLPEQDGREHPTRLRDGAKLAHHDDWDCLDDLEREGLVQNTGSAVNRQYALTDRGREVAAQLRAHKGAGGGFATFTVTGASATEVA
jgi:predicted transcriptional regulator